MAAKASPDLILANFLAAPFSPRGQGSALSYRRLPEGGMVVIAADGRKLWFSAEEVTQAQADMLAETQRKNRENAAKVDHEPPRLNAQPKEKMRQNNGIAVAMVINEGMLRGNDNDRRHQ